MASSSTEYPNLKALSEQNSVLEITTASPQLVKEVQGILLEMGLYSGNIDGIAGGKTLDSLARFKAQNFLNQPTVIGVATIEALLKAVNKPRIENYLKLTKTNKTDKFGLVVLILEYFKNGQKVSSIRCCSGQPYAQVFRTGVESKSGSLQPLPEGKWRINDIQWSNGKDNFNGPTFGAGLGYATIPLDYVGPGITRRSEILIHCDYNRPYSPGTAGCIGCYDDDDLRTVISWLRDSDPKDLYVQWELGTDSSP